MRYSPSFRSSVAGTFNDDPAVVLGLFDEAWPDRATSIAAQAWTCWRDGGTRPGIGYEVAGTQDLVDAVRATGAENVVLAGGLACSDDPSQWLTYEPETRRAIRPPPGTCTTPPPVPAGAAGTPHSPRWRPRCRRWPGRSVRTPARTVLSTRS
ncbi:hypothetical protein GCM10010129_25290 [Streptomyces fumigatiscleroticus]|nr:hypothetical protein GCM10010129_25290 [Streptomyces fumigatiscleroticus]